MFLILPVLQHLFSPSVWNQSPCLLWLVSWPALLWLINRLEMSRPLAYRVQCVGALAKRSTTVTFTPFPLKISSARDLCWCLLGSQSSSKCQLVAFSNFAFTSLTFSATPLTTKQWWTASGRCSYWFESYKAGLNWRMTSPTLYSSPECRGLLFTNVVQRHPGILWCYLFRSQPENSKQFSPKADI